MRFARNWTPRRKDWNVKRNNKCRCQGSVGRTGQSKKKKKRKKNTDISKFENRAAEFTPRVSSPPTQPTLVPVLLLSRAVFSAVLFLSSFFGKSSSQQSSSVDSYENTTVLISRKDVCGNFKASCFPRKPEDRSSSFVQRTERPYEPRCFPPQRPSPSPPSYRCLSPLFLFFPLVSFSQIV